MPFAIVLHTIAGAKIIKKQEEQTKDGVNLQINMHFSSFLAQNSENPFLLWL